MTKDVEPAFLASVILCLSESGDLISRMLSRSTSGRIELSQRRTGLAFQSLAVEKQAVDTEVIWGRR